MWWLKDDGLRCQIFGAFSVLIAAGIVGSWSLYSIIYLPEWMWTIPVLAPTLLFFVGGTLAVIEHFLYKQFNKIEEDPIDRIARKWWQD